MTDSTQADIEKLKEDSWFIIVCSFVDEGKKALQGKQFWQSWSKKYKTARRAQQAFDYIVKNDSTSYICQSGSSKPVKSYMVFRITTCIAPISQQDRVLYKIYDR